MPHDAYQRVCVLLNSIHWSENIFFIEETLSIILCSFFSKYMFCRDITATQPLLFEIPTIQPRRSTIVTFLTWYADIVMSSRSLKQPCFWRMRLPHSTEQRQAGQSPSTGRRWEGSDFRKYLARQITWELVLQDGWIQLSLSGSWRKTKDRECLWFQSLLLLLLCNN